MIDFNGFKKELLSDSKVKAEYDALAPEFEMLKKFIQERKKAKMTQADVAKAMSK